MSPHQIIAVAVRLFAIWIVIYVVRELPVFYFEGSKQGDPYVLTVTIAIALVSLVGFLVLWFFPRTIAQGLLSSSNTESIPPASQDMWLAMGCGLLGLWMLSSALPGLLRDLLVQYLLRAADAGASNLRSWLFYNLAECLIAIWLIFGARGFRKIFWWARTSGRF